ncbi:hypothetical protein CTI12_AA371710 [Artemisia annua]|uniref:Reverse transcriptase domain-containing protein n=1 Tax=Artemisia annua TaxID=35608 RepID=A0A2U1LJR2_ARTAN|nr:hypothetical protein CTI12_AA371710 [Artemisia annua]
MILLESVLMAPVNFRVCDCGFSMVYLSGDVSEYCVIWLHRTTPKESTGERPFSLVYRTEVVIHAEMLIHTERVTMVNQEDNEEALRLNLTLTEEKRDLTAIRYAHSKHKKAKYYNTHVRPVSFKPGDHVRKNEANKAASQGKMSPNWEGPYVIRQTNDNELYLLTTPEGDHIPLP